MKMKEAERIMEGLPAISIGFRVHFEHAGDGLLRSDYFPARGEVLIQTKDKAWELAKKFAVNTKGRCVNIYVVDQKFAPVLDYKEKEIANR